MVRWLDRADVVIASRHVGGDAVVGIGAGFKLIVACEADGIGQATSGVYNLVKSCVLQILNLASGKRAGASGNVAGKPWQNTG